MSSKFNLLLESLKCGKVISEFFDSNVSLRTQFEDTYFIKEEVECFFKSLNIIDYKIQEERKDFSYSFYNVNMNYLYNGQQFEHDLLFKVFSDGYRILKIYITIDKNVKSKRIKCVVSYDGSKFFGYQKQPLQNSVQASIEKVLTDIHQVETTIYSSGRTDRGVHAINQIFHFDTTLDIEPLKWKSILNTYLCDYIYVKETVIVDKTFHSRFDTVSKEYCYKINTKEYNPIQKDYELFVENIDVLLFSEQASKLIGQHDFRSFAKIDSKKNTIRTIYDCRVVLKDDYLYFYIKGNGFMRYMVRNIVGALIDISTGKSNVDILDIVASKSRHSAKNTAFAGGLYLNEVKYN